MEEIKHVTENIFNWAVKVAGGIIAFILGWLARLQFLHNKTEKGLAVNENSDAMRDKEIQEIKASIKWLKNEFNILKMANNTTLARVNLMIEKMK